MKRQKILIVLTLLIGLTGTQISNANKNRIFDYIENSRIEIKKGSYTEDKNNRILNIISQNKITVNFNYINFILNKHIEYDILSYLNKNISLSKLKKGFKKNLQNRKKVHKILVNNYNNRFSSNIFTLISQSGIQIEQIKSIKDIFFKKMSV